MALSFAILRLVFDFSMPPSEILEQFIASVLAVIPVLFAEGNEDRCFVYLKIRATFLLASLSIALPPRSP